MPMTAPPTWSNSVTSTANPEINSGSGDQVFRFMHPEDGVTIFIKATIDGTVYNYQIDYDTDITSSYYYNTSYNGWTTYTGGAFTE